MKEEPMVSIVIPTYNRTRVLRECLQSIDNQSYENIQIIVTDDSTEEDVQQVIMSLQMTRPVEYQRNPYRMGLPTNRNRGIARVKGQLTMSLDDDTVLEPSCIERIVDAYHQLISEGHRVGAIGPAVITDLSRMDGLGLADFAARRFARLQNEPCIRSRLTGLAFMDFSKNTDGIVVIDELHSSSIYPSSVLREVGGYEERLFQGNFICEETDLHARIREKGYSLFFEPRAIIHHKTISGGGCRADTIRYVYYFFRNQSIYTIRHNGVKSLYQIPALSLFIVMSSIASLLSYWIVRKNGRNCTDD